MYPGQAMTPYMKSILSQTPHPPPIPPTLRIRQNIKKNALNAREVTGVVFLNLPPIFNALGASRCTYRDSFYARSHYYLDSTHPMILLFNFSRTRLP
jgi:hypothetical protein